MTAIVRHVTTMKDQEQSVKLRTEGNSFYTKGLDKEALQKYYMALDTAPQDSASYFKAMYNIAVTLVNLGFPEYAETHLKRVLKNSPKLEKLKHLESFSKKLEKCSKISNKNLYVAPVQKLYKGSNELYPQLSSSVKVAYNEDRGRHLVACEDIPAGSVVGLERPTLMISTRHSTNCNHCCRILPLCYIPCEECDARFCNEECRKTSQYFHNFVYHTSYVPDHSTIDLAARIVMNYTKQEIEEIIKSPPNRADVSTPHDHTSFASIMRLQQREFNNYDAALVRAAAGILECTKFLESMGYANCDRTVLKQFLVCALKSVVGRIELNAHLMYHDPCEWVLGKHLASRMLVDAGINLEHSFNTRRIELLDASENISCVLGVCLLPVASIANHSCVPNLVTSFADKDECSMVIRTSRDVFAGEELLHNYGPILGLHSYEYRQARLQKDFTFLCQCESCIMRGYHPTDRRLSCRICCFCHIDFLPHNQTDFCCSTCSGDKSKESAYRELQKKLSEVDAALEVENWDWDADGVHEKAIGIFERALGIYYIGNRKLEDFAVEACLAAMKAGCYEYVDIYVHHLSELRALIFKDRYCSFLANAFLLLAVFEIVRMKAVPKMRNRARLRELKKNINLSRSVFIKIYGSGSVRDRELDFLLQKAEELVT